MKAWKLIIFLFSLNGFIFILSSAGVWGGGTNLAEKTIVSTSAIGVSAVVGALSGTAIASFAGARPGPIVAISVFGGMFWGFYRQLFGIINIIFQGQAGIILTVLTGLNVLIFVAAITQMASGGGWSPYE